MSGITAFLLFFLLKNMTFHYLIRDLNTFLFTYNPSNDILLIKARGGSRSSSVRFFKEILSFTHELSLI